jgi:hypothetical protein
VPTLLEQWWTVQADPDLTSEMRDALLESLRVAAYEAIELPVGIGATTIVVTDVTVVGNVVECNGTGRFSWPLRLYSPPIGIPDPDGTEIAPNGDPWRTDPIEVIARAIESAL